MDLKEVATQYLGRLDPRLMSGVFRYLKKIPFVQERIDREYDGMMSDLEKVVKPYRGRFATHARIPEQGVARDEILSEMEQLRDEEASRWKDGFVSGAVYHGDPDFHSPGFYAGTFHLFTHAFFKGLLFLAAGSVIHAVHTNDIREMGGLLPKMKK